MNAELEAKTAAVVRQAEEVMVSSNVVILLFGSMRIFPYHFPKLIHKVE